MPEKRLQKCRDAYLENTRDTLIKMVRRKMEEAMEHYDKERQQEVLEVFDETILKK